MQKKVAIIGAGPAGLTAAYELLTKTDIIPIVLEADSHVGGLSKTIHYKEYPLYWNIVLLARSTVKLIN